MLFLFIRWLKQHHPEWEADLVALQGGPLIGEIRPLVGNLIIWNQIQRPGRLNRLIARLASLAGIDTGRLATKRMVKKLASAGYQIIYGNSVLTTDLGIEIKQATGARLLIHVHELETIIGLFAPGFARQVPSVDWLVAASQLVRQCLTDRFNATDQQLKVVYEMSETGLTPPTRQPGNRFVVGCSGVVHWRKGDDVMLQVARYLKAHHPDVEAEFCWTGFITPDQQLILEADIRKLNLESTIRFLGPVADPMPLYQQFSVFFLPSREDPFPLVCIEVGLMGKPIILFEGATGIAEITGNEGGVVVPYLNIEKAADAIAAYFRNPALAEQHGDYNRKAFSAFTPDQISPQLYAVFGGSD